MKGQWKRLVLTPHPRTGNSERGTVNGDRNAINLISPQRGEMFIERATSKRFSSLQRSETHAGLPVNVRIIALRWSASYWVQRIFYKHLAPLERNEMLLEVESNIYDLSCQVPGSRFPRYNHPNQFSPKLLSPLN